MAVQPQCPRCGKTAPDPWSDEAGRWEIRSGPEIPTAIVCPDCSTPEGLQEVEDELTRLKIAAQEPSADTVVFIRGEAKVLADCTSSDMEWLRDEVARQREQAVAWADWHAEYSRRAEQEGRP